MGVCYVCCVGCGLCDRLITRSEDLYRSCARVRVRFCDLQTSTMRRPKAVAPQRKAENAQHMNYDIYLKGVFLCLRNDDSMIYTVRSFSFLLWCFSHTRTPHFKVYSPYILWQLFILRENLKSCKIPVYSIVVSYSLLHNIKYTIGIMVYVYIRTSRNVTQNTTSST
jgi:hypothetical protein